MIDPRINRDYAVEHTRLRIAVEADEDFRGHGKKRVARPKSSMRVVR